MDEVPSLVANLAGNLGVLLGQVGNIADQISRFVDIMTGSTGAPKAVSEGFGGFAGEIAGGGSIGSASGTLAARLLTVFGVTGGGSE